MYADPKKLSQLFSGDRRPSGRSERRSLALAYIEQTTPDVPLDFSD